MRPGGLWVELDCGGNALLAEIAPQSLKEMNIHPGSAPVAMSNASAFRRLYGADEIRALSGTYPD